VLSREKKKNETAEKENPSLFDLNTMEFTDLPAIQDFSLVKGDITCLFKNLEEELIKRIKSADAVVGCVAWLTNPRILDALKNVPASILVQKEDFLRPDMDTEKDTAWASKLRKQYSSIRPFYWHNGGGDEVDDIVNIYSVARPCFDNEAIRCVGNHNSEKKPAFPRMHNKFLVFLTRIEPLLHEHDCCPERYKSSAVWTGSFNFTVAGNRSFENAVIIEDCAIARRYTKEWYQILGFSEFLDWNSEWCSPDMRDGT
jgi:hypothetical protein